MQQHWAWSSFSAFNLEQFARRRDGPRICRIDESAQRFAEEFGLFTLLR